MCEKNKEEREGGKKVVRGNRNECGKKAAVAATKLEAQRRNFEESRCF